MLAKASNEESIAALMTHAYLQLVNVPWDREGARCTSLARYGNYEIRLVELLPVASTDSPALWLELHDLGAQVTLDSVGCDDFESAIVAARQVISQAKKLGGEQRGTPA